MVTVCTQRVSVTDKDNECKIRMCSSADPVLRSDTEKLANTRDQRKTGLAVSKNSYILDGQIVLRDQIFFLQFYSSQQKWCLKYLEQVWENKDCFCGMLSTGRIGEHPQCAKELWNICLCLSAPEASGLYSQNSYWLVWPCASHPHLPCLGFPITKWGQSWICHSLIPGWESLFAFRQYHLSGTLEFFDSAVEKPVFVLMHSLCWGTAKERMPQQRQNSHCSLVQAPLAASRISCRRWQSGSSGTCAEVVLTL